MEQEKLYRDPGLSLWDLAQHVGVNSNHVSQTLNATLEKNFFDYVNGWRIKEAAALLQSTSKSILDVTYEVGFNSRSSFYTAFKRELGTTPKAYKTAQSDNGRPVSKVA
jgi:AraC-like DNA-binding protein